MRVYTSLYICLRKINKILNLLNARRSEDEATYVLGQLMFSAFQIIIQFSLTLFNRHRQAGHNFAYLIVILTTSGRC